MCMNILLHDTGIQTKYFDKFKELKLLDKSEADTFFKEHWKEINTVIDCSSNNYLYKKFLEKNPEESTLKKTVKFLTVKNKKIVKAPFLKNYIFAKKKENFDEEKYKQIIEDRQLIEDTLEYICNSYKSALEKELDTVDDKAIDISALTDEQVYFVKENNGISTGNILDINSLFLLKELKEILLYKI